MDDEWDRCLEEAASFQTGSQFRQLFVTLLLMNNPFDPLALFDRHFQALSDDCRYLLQYRFHIDSPTDQAIISLTLQKLADIFEKAGKSLQDYKLPLPSVTLDELNGIPGMIAQELTYDRALLAQRWDKCYARANREQGLTLDIIVHAINSNIGGLFFIDGLGGTGKTFVENLLLAYVRSQAVDTTLKDILKNAEPFSGITVVFGGMP